ncbi:MAG: MucB/RseB C-terminal domain-containing protein [Gammaproteobacteria bacterium]|nr:MucB/RseB C-terminal domain-containing protein [Gammaproteobacteria bacterium]
MKFLLLSVAFFWGFSVQADVDSAAMDWVQKMSSAMQELSYQGRFVYLHNGQLESMSILHVNDAQGKRERLISLNGEAREILRDNNNLTCVWPSSRQVVVDQSNQANASPIWIPEDVERLGKFYDFKLSGNDRVADHPAVIVAIDPKDEFRYGMKVWIHEKNGLLLQSQLFDEQGRASEQIMFTEIAILHYDDQKAFKVLPEIDSGYALIRSHSGEGDSQHPADANWSIEKLPQGFWIESAFRKKMMNSPDFTQQMILTDGMASVSVFIEKKSQQGLSGESSMGAVNAYGTTYKDYSITAIGEVPAKTVRQIALSMAYLN